MGVFFSFKRRNHPSNDLCDPWHRVFHRSKAAEQAHLLLLNLASTGRNDHQSTLSFTLLVEIIAMGYKWLAEKIFIHRILSLLLFNWNWFLLLSRNPCRCSMVFPISTAQWLTDGGLATHCYVLIIHLELTRRAIKFDPKQNAWQIDRLMLVK